jgi:Cu+-exporting ATPase
VDTLVVDKTGTLTEGRPRVVSVIPATSLDEKQILRFAATLERGSEHPLAGAILAAAKERSVDLGSLTEFQSRTGKGVLGKVDGHAVALGNRALFAELEITSGELEKSAKSQESDGQTVMFVAADGAMIGIIGVADPIKSTTPEALAKLHREGIRIIMLTGDSRATADSVARKLGIDQVHAEILPGQKSEIVKQLQAEGHIVAMAGDGVNDAPALWAPGRMSPGKAPESLCCAATCSDSRAREHSAAPPCVTSAKIFSSPLYITQSASPSPPACSTRSSVCCSARSWPAPP